MIHLLLTAALVPADPTPVDLAAFSVADARQLHGRPVVATFTAGKPSFTWNEKTITGPADRGDGIEWTAVPAGERVIDPGERVRVPGRLWVIDHATAMVGGVLVPAWVEVRVEEE